MELIRMLVDQLGVSEQQAAGGSGLLFKMAKEKLDNDEFNQVTDAVPEAEELISSAPESGGLAGALGGLASSFGGGDNQIGNLVSLVSGFKKLNLDPDMVNKFIPIVLSFIQSKGGETAKGLLEKVIK